MTLSSVPRGTQVFPYTCSCTEKNKRGNGKPPLRARFCMRGHLARNKDTNVSTAPFFYLKAIRTVTAAAVVLSWDLRTDDFKRAYLQADSLSVPMHTRIPPEAGETDDCVWAFSCPIYGKDDAGRHLFFTQRKVILSSTNLSTSHTHEAVYYFHRLGALCTYSDDTYSTGTPPFMRKVDDLMEAFRTQKSDVKNVRFAGIHIEATPDGVATDGRAYPARLARVSARAGVPESTPLADPSLYESVAAGHLWIPRITRPDRACDASLLCNRPAPALGDAVDLNRLTAYINDNPLSRVYPRLEEASLRISAYAGYSGSPQTPAHRHHQGYLVAATDDSGRLAPLHWESRRPRRTVHSKKGGELLAMADAIQDAVDIRNLLAKLLAQPLPITAFTDSAAANNCVVGCREPSELLSKPDAVLFRQARHQGTVAEVCRVDSADNPADALSKPTFLRVKPNDSLAAALSSSQLRTPIRANT